MSTTEAKRNLVAGFINQLSEEGLLSLIEVLGGLPDAQSEPEPEPEPEVVEYCSVSSNLNFLVLEEDALTVGQEIQAFNAYIEDSYGLKD